MNAMSPALPPPATQPQAGIPSSSTAAPVGAPTFPPGEIDNKPLVPTNGNVATPGEASVLLLADAPQSPVVLPSANPGQGPLMSRDELAGLPVVSDGKAATIDPQASDTPLAPLQQHTRLQAEIGVTVEGTAEVFDVGRPAVHFTVIPNKQEVEDKIKNLEQERKVLIHQKLPTAGGEAGEAGYLLRKFTRNAKIYENLDTLRTKLVKQIPQHNIQLYFSERASILGEYRRVKYVSGSANENSFRRNLAMGGEKFATQYEKVDISNFDSMTCH